MIKFTGQDGKVYTAELTLGAVERIKSLVGVDLLYPEAKQEGSDGDSLLVDLNTDVRLLVNVLRALFFTGDQTDEQFAENLGVKGYNEAAESFWDDYQSFFLSLGRPIVALNIQSLRNSSDAMLEKLKEKVAETNRVAQEKAIEILDNIDVEKMLSDRLSGSLPGLSASTPEDSHLDN